MDLITIIRFDKWDITEALFVDSRKKDISMISMNVIESSVSMLVIRIIE